MHPLTQAVISGNRTLAAELTRQCLAEGEAPNSIIEDRLVPGMAVVGERYKNDEIFVPEMLIAARAMKEALAILEPLLASAGTKAAHSAVIGTVEGDLHDIGKNLVAMMWTGANIDVIDLGVNVSPAAFARAVQEHRPDIVGMSALLTTTMPGMRKAVAAVKDSGLPVKIVVGGAPVTADFAAEVGADGFAADAGSAVDVALDLLGAARFQTARR
jgi:5-methyltetrahydrofolate--homocysteine methyltransferase